MKKSFEVNLGGRIFNFDEDAYELLNSYIESLKGCFSKQDGGEDIIADIEVRLGELCETRMREGRARIVDFSMMDEFITRMGRPESLAAEVEGDSFAAEENSAADGDEQNKREPWRDAMLLGKKYFRDTRNGLLGGVFSGLAAYTGFNVWLLRVVCLLLFFFVGGIIIPIIYIVSWLTLPMATSITDLLRMRDIKPAPGERVEEAWAREYERASAEIINGGIARENKGCLSGCIIGLLTITIIPIILLLAYMGIAGTMFYNIFTIANSNPMLNSSFNLLTSIILIPFLVFIPLFLIGHYMFKRKNKVAPLKKWIKILLVAVWIIALLLYVSSPKNRLEIPLLGGNVSYFIKNSTCTGSSISDVQRFVDEVKEWATSPDASVLKNYFLGDNHPDSKRCTRVLWHCITSASGDSLLPYTSECTRLDDKIIWRLMPRDEWMEFVRTPESVSSVEIHGSVNPDEDFKAELCCVVDTVAKKMFVDLSRCTGMVDLRIDVNSIPGWTVDYTKDGKSLLEYSAGSFEFSLKVYSDEEYLPKLIVRSRSIDGSNVVAKDMRHTMYRHRMNE